MKKMKRYLLILVLVASLLFEVSTTAADMTGNAPSILWLSKNYEWVLAFSEGLAPVQDKNGKWGFIDTSGKEVVSCRYDHVFPFSEGLAAVGNVDKDTQIGKHGYINARGEEIIPLQYEYETATEFLDVASFSEGLAPVKMKNGKKGYINKQGKVVIAPRYDVAMKFQEGLAVVSQADKESYIDKTGQALISLPSGKIGYPFAEGLAQVIDKNNKTGYINRQGKQEIAARYGNSWMNFSTFSEGLAAVVQDNKIGYIDHQGKTVIPFQEYQEVLPFSEGMTAVGVHVPFKEHIILCHWGYMNRDGELVIPLLYEAEVSDMNGTALTEWNSFKEGLAVVQKGDRYTYINQNGVEIFPFSMFDQITAFSGGYAMVKKNARWGILTNPLKTGVQPVWKKEAVMAAYSNVVVSVNGQRQSGVEIYNIGNRTFFKLRDIAQLMNHTKKSFAVEWNGSKKQISLITGKIYQAQGNELQGGDGQDKTAILSDAVVEIDGKSVTLTAYVINGHNYYKIRDLAEALDIDVDWDGATQTVILATN